MGIYFCTSERLLDAGVRFSCSSWKRLNVSSLSLLGGELSKQANSKHPPGPLAENPLHDWSKVIREAFVESFPGPCSPHPPQPTHPPHSVSPTMYQAEVPLLLRGPGGRRLPELMLIEPKSRSRKVRLVPPSWVPAPPSSGMLLSSLA